MHRVVPLPWQALAFTFAWAVLSGCTRSAAASFVPVLEVGLRLRRSAALQQSAHEGQTLATEFYLWLSFRPQNPAASVPLMSDASGLLVQAPCDENDQACLDEAAESEPDLAAIREDVP